MNIHVMTGGLYTTIQDWPGRVGYWNVGVPPSGPMDPMAFRLANLAVGNAGDEAGLEITFMGPTLRFETETVFALTGAVLQTDLSGSTVPWWRAVTAPAGSVLTLGAVQGAGCRTYMAIQGGIDVPLYLGSRSTFPTGKLGGLEGRPLRDGDRLKLIQQAGQPAQTRVLGENQIPTYGESWEIGAIPGPYAAPDYFTEADQRTFFSHEYSVYYNSSRLGYRLEGGPKPEFARESGGEGGTHPSNVHDYPYAVGTVNFTGDMPIIITVDGPSLGGFICMATVPSSELWKVGQAKGSDKIRFRRMTVPEAVKARKNLEKILRA
jgi:urea carboxylase